MGRTRQERLGRRQESVVEAEGRRPGEAAALQLAQIAGAPRVQPGAQPEDRLAQGLGADRRGEHRRPVAARHLHEGLALADGEADQRLLRPQQRLGLGQCQRPGMGDLGIVGEIRRQAPVEGGQLRVHRRQLLPPVSLQRPPARRGRRSGGLDDLAVQPTPAHQGLLALAHHLGQSIVAGRKARRHPRHRPRRRRPPAQLRHLEGLRCQRLAR